MRLSSYRTHVSLTPPSVMFEEEQAYSQYTSTAADKSVAASAGLSEGMMGLDLLLMGLE